MGLDISKIVNGQLQKLAYLKDENNNSILEAEEYSIFKAEAAEVEGVSSEDFNQAMGLFKSEEAKAMTAPEEAKVKRTPDEKQDFARAKNTVFRYIDILTGKCSREDLIEQLDQRLNLQKDDPRYVEIKADIEKVMSLMDESYESYKDINKAHLSTLNKMSKEGIRNPYYEKILRKLETIAKTEVGAAAQEEIAARYEELATEESETKKSDEEIMEQIKAEYKADKKYNKENRFAYRTFEEKTFISDAKQKVYNTIDENNEDTKWLKISKKAKDELKADEEWDKYTRKAFYSKYGDKNSDEFIFGLPLYDFYGNEVARSKARDNKVEQSQIKSEKEVLKALGKKSAVYEAMVNSGVIQVDEDGNVDLSLLTELIKSQCGVDNVMNRNAKIDTAIAEKFRTASKLAVETDLDDLSENEAKKLAKLCGIEYESKNWKGIVGGALTGALSAFVGDRGAALLAKSTELLLNASPITAISNIKLNGITSSQITELPAGATATDIKDVDGNILGVELNISTLVKMDNMKVEIPNNIPINWYTIALGAAIGAATNLRDKGEIPVTAIQFKEKDFNKYMERTNLELARLEAEGYAEALNCIASAYIREDGSWDSEGYKSLLNKMAGDGGKLNKKEILDGCKLAQESTKKDDKPKEDETPIERHFYSRYDKAATAPTYAVEETPVIDGIKTSWAKIAQQYDCLVDKYGLSGAIRILKIAQAINDGNYSEERLEQLYMLSKQGRSNLRGIEGLDYEKYCNVLDATYLSKLEYDAQGNAIPGTGVKVPTMLAGCERDDSKSLKVKITNMADRVVRPTGHSVGIIQTGFGSSAEYHVNIDGTKSVHENKETRDALIEDFKKQYENAEEQEWELETEE